MRVEAALAPNPSPAHEARVALLDSLAALTGHRQRVPLPLPDGRRPDVLMVDVERGWLFLGDGKESEGPNDVPSRCRIDSYVGWLLPQARSDRRLTLAICCPT